MQVKPRIPLIAGNWKMNLTRQQSLDLVNQIRFGLPNPGQVDVIIAPTFLHLSMLSDLLDNSYLSIAAQNLHHQDSGAFTGECSGTFLKDVGTEYVIIGHSERRTLFGETNDQIRKKTEAAFRHDLIPILCIGETLEERENDCVETVLTEQLAVLSERSTVQIAKMVIAYEPVWAIGTGKSASPGQVDRVHALIRSQLNQLAGSDSVRTRILYGGSVKASNCRELFELPDVDGALIGGASLKASEFIEIVRLARIVHQSK